MLVQTTNWLLCEAGLQVPEMAAATLPTHRPAGPRGAGRSGPLHDTVILPLADASYQQLGYEPSIARALVAVRDMFFERILTAACTRRSAPAASAGTRG